MTAKDLMARVDARILRSRIADSTAVFAGREVTGAFSRKSREVPLPDGGVLSVAISFDCQYVEEIGLLLTDDIVPVDGVDYRFLRELVPGGDESGLTIVELGEVL